MPFEIENKFFIIFAFVANVECWRQRVAAYYDTTADAAKPILTRLIFRGRIRPDDDSASSRVDDTLPCLVELQCAVDAGQSILEQRDGTMKSIMAMQQVREATIPKATALALYLFDGENSALRTLARFATDNGMHILSYVFGGIYVLAKDDADAKRVFKVIARQMFEHTRLEVALKDMHGIKLTSFSTPPA